MIWYHL